MSAPRWMKWPALCLTLGLSLTATPLPAQPGPPEDLFKGPERARVQRESARLEAIQARHQDALLKLPKVHGMGVSVDPRTKELVFLVSVERGAAAPKLPAQIEGVRVVVEHSEPPRAMNGGSSCIPCHANQVPLPVPMGNSTGNQYYCSACTLGFKVCQSGVQYYVTNAHCSPDAAGCEGKAPIGSNTYHRGKLDASCTLTTDIGDVSLHATPRCGSDNLVDAALMRSSNSLTSWSIRDIGTPGFRVNVMVGDAVQKSGRTTGLTYGTVASTNYTTNVSNYCCGSPKFVRQIKVNATTLPFIQPGDSGSGLLNRATPPGIAGLLFAGPSDGSYGIANHIDYVLATLGNVSLDPNCTAPTCQSTCYDQRDDCYETYCYWNYDQYMCETGCEQQYQECLGGC